MTGDIRITAAGWDGIFLYEEEAALALAGRPLPDRILGYPQVAPEVRFRAASSPEFRQEILGEGTSRLTIARWTWEGTIERPIGLEVNESVKVEVYRTKMGARGSVVTRFKVAVSGRSYDLDETSTLIDMLQIGYRLCRAAEGHIKTRELLRDIDEKDKVWQQRHSQMTDRKKEG